jgi:hypothetical protein
MDEAVCNRHVSGRTLNYTNSKFHAPEIAASRTVERALPRFAVERALPRFALSEPDPEETLDPLDVAATAPRWALGAALRLASDPAFLPSLTPLPAAVSRSEHDSPSVAPVALPSVPIALALAPAPTSLAHPVGAAMPPRAKPSLAAAVALGCVALSVLGASIGGLAGVGVRNGSLARLRERVRPAAALTGERSAASAPAASAPPASAPVPSLPAPSAPVIVPTVSIDSLPAPSVAANESLVSFPASAHGHRVFFDGRLVPIAESGPTRLRCGRHMLKIGSRRKAHVVDLACGRAVSVE